MTLNHMYGRICVKWAYAKRFLFWFVFRHRSRTQNIDDQSPNYFHFFKWKWKWKRRRCTDCFFFLNFVWPSKYTAKCVQLTNTNSTRHIQNELKFLWLDVKTRHIFLTCFDMFNVSHSIYRDKGIRTREWESVFLWLSVIKKMVLSHGFDCN